MSRGTLMNESWHTPEYVMAHLRLSLGTLMNSSYHTQDRRRRAVKALVAHGKAHTAHV